MAIYAEVIAILALFAVLAFLIARFEGLAFMAPGSTRAIRGSAESFCHDRCRENGQCPLTASDQRATACPLFKYVSADVPTVEYGSPFEAARGT